MADDKPTTEEEIRAATRVFDKLFLGSEFATWLYFYLQAEGFEVSLPEAFPDREAGAPAGGVVEFAVGKRVVLRTLDGSGTRVGLAGPGLDDSGELYQAVMRGAYIDVLRVALGVGERVYEATVHADGGLSGVKLPVVFAGAEDKVDLGDILSVRSACLDEVEQIVDALYQRFVNRRLAQAWRTEDLKGVDKRIRDGISARLKATSQA
jgi:hypothetical protein